ncbi:hypothetical protein [Paraburkholderia acidisoli]|uniref:Uncharacterized protein n=1 Tax=Paraburkholderia acidisoli TaxID=2571748 RepID=A0A7Z2JEQ6_9BURK|nr:hypothetical protein [Paraburkholderia acidisoli]QGZ60744.1 hypothetical protein FAZ98_02765 [Paraburkholderia acidisoli]
MLPLLSLHDLATSRGDGLRPELLALFRRHALASAGLSAQLETQVCEASPPEHRQAEKDEANAPPR